MPATRRDQPRLKPRPVGETRATLVRPRRVFGRRRRHSGEPAPPQLLPLALPDARDPQLRVGPIRRPNGRLWAKPDALRRH